jgi:hypothetical protein
MYKLNPAKVMWLYLGMEDAELAQPEVKQCPWCGVALPQHADDKH